MFERLFIGALVVGALVGFAMPGARKPANAPAPAAPTPALTTASTHPAEGSPLETVLTRANDGHFYVDARVNGQLVHFLIDTGATGVALTRDDAQRAGIQMGFDPPQLVGQGASGAVMGHFVTIHHIAVDQKEAYDLRGVVIPEGLGVSLLGQNFLAQVASVQISGDRMVLK